MKKTSTHAAILAGQMITAGLLFQGCQVYQPGERSLLGGRNTPTEPGEATVVTLSGESRSPAGADVTTIAPKPVVSAGQVGAPGTYQEFVVGEGVKDPHDGLTKLKTKHVPPPPPAIKPSHAAPSAPAFTADGKYKLYRVKSGDTAGQIANSHGMRLADFLAVNGIKTANTIRVGQQFKVPADGKPMARGGASTPTVAASDGSAYTVVAGDSLSVIAQKHGMKTAELMALNGIADPHKIRVGQKLRVKGSAKAAPTVEKTKSAEDKPVEVKPVEDAVAPVEPVDNGTAPTSIESLLKDVGSTTSVPKTPVVATPPTPAVATPVVATPAVAGAREHVVREGEDIYAIALHYKVRPVDIRSLNNLTSNVLTAGMVIKIPPAAQ